MGVGERALCHKSGIKIDINVAPERQLRGGAAGGWLQLTLNSIPALLLLSLSSFVHRSRVEFSSDNLPQASSPSPSPYPPPPCLPVTFQPARFVAAKCKTNKTKSDAKLIAWRGGGDGGGGVRAQAV